MTPTGFLLCCITAALLLTSPASGATLSGELIQPPDLAILGSLTEKYQKVAFDHELHDGYASCAECHHHVSGEAPSNPACTSCHRTGISVSSVACKSCHLKDRFSPSSLTRQNTETRYHIDIPGLVGAYHLRCINCHQAITAGPTGCLECHDKSSP